MLAKTTTKREAAKVEQRRIADLRPYPRNARVHSPEQIKQIAAAITEFGWTMPLLIDEDDMILAGHGRVEAAKRLGIAVAPVTARPRVPPHPHEWLAAVLACPRLCLRAAANVADGDHRLYIQKHF
jgi:ParB-like nuclease domain